MTSWRIIEGDCIEVLAAMEPASVDAVCTDPPYGLEFMGKEWDSFKTGRAAAYRAGGSLHDPAGRRGKGGAGPNYTQHPAKRCAKCGKQAWSGSPCQCAEPEWIMDASTMHAFQSWCEAWAREALRVLKPGGHLLAFGGTRTYHRLTAGVEDAGFEIRDCLAWMYGSGFPKSLDVSKAIDKAAGHARGSDYEPNHGNEVFGHGMGGGHTTATDPPVTPEAESWQGWGTALKPAFEPIILARKPLAGTVAGNVLEHGTGALNVDGCRIGTTKDVPASPSNTPSRICGTGEVGAGRLTGTGFDPDVGRWPANVLLDGDAAAMLDAQTGDLHSQDPATRNNGRKPGWSPSGTDRPMLDKANPNGGDSGGASRFYYVAKASSVERSAGLDGKIGVCRCRVANTEASPPRDTDAPTGADDPKWSMSGSGSNLTDPSPTATKSTIATSTDRTTPSRTSNSSLPPSTNESTARTIAELARAGSDAAQSAPSGNPPPLSTSISAAKAGSSTDGADRATSHESSPTSSSAVCADCGGVIEGAWKNTHPLEPTVKPITLMRWLVRLVTPPGGTVLDPFTGSGTTGCAAVLEGFHFVGVEREAEYRAIAEARIAWWSAHPDGMALVDRLEAERVRQEAVASGQLDFFGEAA